MRKVTILVLILNILFVNSFTYANSGPTYWSGYPSSEILTIDENNSIAVEKEDLIFDFTMDENLKGPSYSISSLVTAKYTMSNLSEEDQTIQMAFPFISTMQGFDPEAIDIKVNDERIPFEVFIGGELNSPNRSQDREGQLDFSTIVKSVSSSEYAPRNYNLNEIGTLYTYDVKPEGEEYLNVLIEHNWNRDKSRIMSKGFNGYRIIEGTEGFIARIPGDEELEIFITGEDVDFDFAAYLDGELTEETDNYTLDIRTEEVPVRDYLLRDVEIFKEELDYLHYLADNQIFNMYARRTDEFIEQNVMNLGIDVLFGEDSVDRVFLLVYEVDFQSSKTNHVSVSYISIGSMDRTETSDPIHTFDYILNPARNWASFKNLNIQVKPPAEYPYIIDSSLNLNRKENGDYIGSFQSLPETDFAFSLYSKAEVTTMDRIKGYFNYNSRLIITIAPSIFGLLLGIVIRLIHTRFKKNKK